MRKIFTLIAVAASGLGMFAQDVVVNKTTGTGYANIKDAVAAVNDGDVLEFAADYQMDAALNNFTKSFTIQGANPNVTLRIPMNSSGNPISFINMAAADKTITVKDLTVTMPEGKTTTGNNPVQQGGGNVVFSNVTFSGIAYENTKNPGIIRILTAPQSTVLDNVKFVNCSNVMGGVDQKFMINNAVGATSTITVKGEANYGINFNSVGGFINDGGVTAGSNVVLYGKTGTDGAILVKGCNDLFKFSIDGTASMLVPEGADLKATKFQKVILLHNEGGVLTGTGFGNIPGASGAISQAKDGDIIVVNGELDFTSNFSVPENTTLTVIGRNENAVIAPTQNKEYIQAKKAGANLILKNIAFDGSKISVPLSNWIVRVGGFENTSATLQNVIFRNITPAADDANGYVSAYNGGVLNIDGITFENCAEPEAHKVVLTEQGSTLAGINEGMSIAFTGSNVCADAQALQAATAPYPVFAAHAACILGATANPELFAAAENFSIAKGVDDNFYMVEDARNLAPEFPNDDTFFSHEGGKRSDNFYDIHIESGESTVLTFNVPAGMTLYISQATATRAAAEESKYTEPITVVSPAKINLRLVQNHDASKEAVKTMTISEDVVAGIKALESGAAAQYYTIGGVAVDAANLTPGLYIRRQGDKVSKIVIR